MVISLYTYYVVCVLEFIMTRISHKCNSHTYTFITLDPHFRTHWNSLFFPPMVKAVDTIGNHSK